MTDPPPAAVHPRAAPPCAVRPPAPVPPSAGTPEHLEVTMPRPIRTPRKGGAR
ncbi:hypothetical protein AB0L25_11835 [Spirillospora sp. NPDC052242]